MTHTGGIDLAGHTLANGRLPRSRAARRDLACQRFGFLGRSMSLGVGCQQHTLMVNRDEPVSDGHLDGLTRQPHPNRIELARETDLAGLSNPTGGDWFVCWHGRIDRVRGCETEPFPRHHITNALMAPLVVVLMHPRIELGLRVSDRLEYLAVQELASHRLVPPLDLAGRSRRTRRRQNVLDPVLATDPVEQHLTSAWPEPASEHFAVIRQDLLRHPKDAHRLGQRLTRRTCRRPLNHMRRNHEPGMIIDPRHDRRLPPVHQPHPTNDVHLPQLHRPRSFPPPIISLLTTSSLWLDQPVTNQTPIHRRTARQRHHPLSLQPEQQRARTPPRMQPAQLHDPRLHHRRHLMRTRQRLGRPIRQTRQPTRRVTTQPTMHRLTRHPEPDRHIRHRRSLVHDLEHSLITQLHNTQLHQHDDPPRTDNDDERHYRRGLSYSCREQARVTQLPEPLSPSYRSQSPNRNTPTGANMSTMNRNSTHRRNSSAVTIL